VFEVARSTGKERRSLRRSWFRKRTPEPRQLRRAMSSMGRDRSTPRTGTPKQSRPFAQGLASVKINGQYGYVVRTGEVVIPVRFEHASRFQEDRAQVALGGKWGYIDPSGNFVVEPK